MKFILKIPRGHWQSLRCLIIPFPSDSWKAVRKTMYWEASYGRRGLFLQLEGKSLLVCHQTECWTVWITFTSVAHRNTAKKLLGPIVWLHVTSQLLLSHSSVFTNGHFIKSHDWWVLQKWPQDLSVTQSNEYNKCYSPGELHFPRGPERRSPGEPLFPGAHAPSIQCKGPWAQAQNVAFGTRAWVVPFKSQKAICLSSFSFLPFTVKHAPPSPQ